MSKLKVRYTATFELVIDVPEQEEVRATLEDVYADEICDIEPGEGEYKEDSFEVESVELVDD